MAFNFSPVFNGWQFFTPSGLPLSGGFLNTYLAGTSTPASTFTTSVGNVPNSNPIALLSDGRVPQEIWLDSTKAYKFVLTDSLLNQIGTYDNIVGIDNSVPAALSEWVVSGLTPSYVNATTFTLAGNQTALFEIGRRVRYTLGAGQYTGSITNSVFGAVTTVTLVTDAIPLDGSLSAVDYGFLDALKPSVPTAFKSPVSTPSLSSSGDTSTVTFSASGLATLSVGASLGNTNSASATVVDWYDRGITFTPTISFGGASVGITYNINTLGRAVRIGNTVLFRCRTKLTSKGSSVGAAQVNNLPFAPGGAVIAYVAQVDASSMAGLISSINAICPVASTNITLSQWGATGTGVLTDANFTNTSDVYITGQYQVS